MCHALSGSTSTQFRDLQSKFYGRFDTFSLVVIRTAKELGSIISGNPFQDAKPAQVGVMLFADPVPKGLFKGGLKKSRFQAASGFVEDGDCPRLSKTRHQPAATRKMAPIFIINYA
jgi:hypothetical protein